MLVIRSHAVNGYYIVKVKNGTGSVVSTTPRCDVTFVVELAKKCSHQNQETVETEENGERAEDSVEYDPLIVTLVEDRRNDVEIEQNTVE